MDTPLLKDPEDRQEIIEIPLPKDPDDPQRKNPSQYGVLTWIWLSIHLAGLIYVWYILLPIIYHTILIPLGFMLQEVFEYLATRMLGVTHNVYENTIVQECTINVVYRGSLRVARIQNCTQIFPNATAAVNNDSHSVGV